MAKLKVCLEMSNSLIRNHICWDFFYLLLRSFLLIRLNTVGTLTCNCSYNIVVRKYYTQCCTTNLLSGHPYLLILWRVARRSYPSMHCAINGKHLTPCMTLDCGRKLKQKSTRKHGEHVNSTKKGPRCHY